MRNWQFLPNGNFDLVSQLIANEDAEKCKIIADTFYHTAKNRYHYVSETMTEKHIYPLVHSTNKNGNRFFYTSIKNTNHFIPKIIFGDSGINNCLLDINGEYGVTNHGIGILIENIEDANRMKEFLDSDDFKKILKSKKNGNS